ncbi:pyrimidine-specific ribonucleoside hydrolase RihA-like [Protopterus annectens]|uniref:pyrimidine-specific ribonucleoside hydrolase RihA-like n=1 Tax=Protopterus annectens TaxID=7888 RepID=UPI001CFC18F4|nr:pyrimidine-specific ribonucleoside hydrolase RihA-like [Protopterus annectens]
MNEFDVMKWMFLDRGYPCKIIDKAWDQVFYERSNKYEAIIKYGFQNNDMLQNTGLGLGPVKSFHKIVTVRRGSWKNPENVFLMVFQEPVSLVATGPLTNLALAVKLDPSFPQKLKSLYIMGGNMRGQGNRTVCAEFNFALDPEAAYIVMREYTCPTYIATLEYTHDNKLPWEFFTEWVNQDSEKARFMKKITANYKSRVPGFFVSYDSYAMAAVIDESVIKEYIQCAVSVELGGKYARGLLVLDPHNLLVTPGCLKLKIYSPSSYCLLDLKPWSDSSYYKRIGGNQ